MNTRKGKTVTPADHSRRRRFLIGISLFLLLGLSLFTGKVAFDRAVHGDDAGRVSAQADSVVVQPSLNEASANQAIAPEAGTQRADSSNADLTNRKQLAKGGRPSNGSAKRRAVYADRHLKWGTQQRARIAKRDPLSRFFRQPLFGEPLFSQQGDLSNGRRWKLVDGKSTWTAGTRPRPIKYPAWKLTMGDGMAAGALAEMTDLCPELKPAGLKTAAKIVYVDASATGLNIGTTWADAYTNLQHAMRTASAGEYWIAKGTYSATAVPGGDAADKRTYSFVLGSGMHLYGGFDATEITRSERNPAINETILDGDSAFHVVVGSDNSTLDGLTIQNGDAKGGLEGNFGGGVFNFYANPTIKGCLFRGNRADDAGGAIANDFSDPTIVNCVFTSNISRYGGAISNMDSNAEITNCTFFGNTAVYGGGVDNYRSQTSILNSIFWGNVLNTTDPAAFDRLVDDDPMVTFEASGTLGNLVAPNIITYTRDVGPTGPFDTVQLLDTIRVAGTESNDGLYLVVGYQLDGYAIMVLQDLTDEGFTNPPPFNYLVTIDLLTATDTDIYVDPVGTSVATVDYTYLQQDITNEPGPPYFPPAGVSYTISGGPTGTASADGMHNTIVLNGADLAADDFYNGQTITLNDPPEAGTVRTILDYDNATNTATLSLPWNSGIYTPLTGAPLMSHNLIYSPGAAALPYTGEEPGLLDPPDDVRLKTLVPLTGTLLVVGPDWFTYNLGAQSEKENDDVGRIISIVSGPGAPQSRRIIAYNATTQEVTVDSPWSTVNGSAPDNTSTYSVEINTVCYRAGIMREGVPTDDMELNVRQELDGIVDMGAYENGYDVNVAGELPLYHSEIGQFFGTDTVQLSQFGSRIDGAYIGMFITITTGNPPDAVTIQTREILGYDGVSKVALVDADWTDALVSPGPGIDPEDVSNYFIFDTFGEAQIVQDGAELDIPDGQDEPNEDNLTTFDPLVGLEQRYTVRNNGLRPIKLTGVRFVELVGDDAVQFTVTNQPGSTGFEPMDIRGVPQTVIFDGGDLILDPGSTVDFTIAFLSREHNVPYTAKVVIRTTCARKNFYDFVIGGTYMIPGLDPDGNPVVVTIDVSGNETPIGDGDTGTSLANHTGFGNIRVGRGTMVREFTIASESNAMTPVLELTGGLGPGFAREYVRITGPNAAEFVIIAQPEFPDDDKPTFIPTIQTEESVTFQIQFIGPDDQGPKYATVEINYTFSGEEVVATDETFTFTISAYASPDTGGGDAGDGTEPDGGAGGGGGGGGVIGVPDGSSASGCSMVGPSHPGSFYLPFLAVLALLGLGRFRFARAE